MDLPHCTLQTTLKLIRFRDLRSLPDAEAHIAHGGFSVIQKATYLSGVVAVKIAKPGLANSEALRREIELYDRIGRQSNIATVLGVCVDAPDGRVRQVMKFCVLGSVDQWIRCQLDLRPPDTAEQVRAAALCLSLQ